MSNITSVAPNSIKESTYIYDYIDGYDALQILYCIGRYSYIINSEIDSGTSFTIRKGRAGHNLQIGQFCSIAEGVRFVTGRNHNYKSVSMGVCELMDTSKQGFNGFCQKGSIIVQNDVWIGRNSTIMSGVIIRNGAVIADNSHVVSDVPPFAIVGGNPARILGYRFNEQIINQLQQIRWWNWTEEKIVDNSQVFSLRIEEFCKLFYDDKIEQDSYLIKKHDNQYLYIMDFDDLYPCYSFVMNQFIEKFIEASEKKVLILYVPTDEINEWEYKIQEVELLINKLGSIPNLNITMKLISGGDIEEIIAQSEYYITNRRKETVFLTECAYEYNTKIISGVEATIFQEHIGFI